MLKSGGEEDRERGEGKEEWWGEGARGGEVTGSNDVCGPCKLIWLAYLRGPAAQAQMCEKAKVDENEGKKGFGIYFMGNFEGGEEMVRRGMLELD